MQCACIPASGSRPRSDVSQTASDGRRLTGLEAGFVGPCSADRERPVCTWWGRCSELCAETFAVCPFILYFSFSVRIFSSFSIFSSSYSLLWETARISPLLMDCVSRSRTASPGGLVLVRGLGTIADINFRLGLGSTEFCFSRAEGERQCCRYSHGNKI